MLKRVKNVFGVCVVLFLLFHIFKVVLRPKTTKKIFLFFFEFQNYVN